jgi:hypothetical protein
MNELKKYRFIDSLTNEFFDIECYSYELAFIHCKNKKFADWCEGRILETIEIED